MVVTKKLMPTLGRFFLGKKGRLFEGMMIEEEEEEEEEEEDNFCQWCDRT